LDLLYIVAVGIGIWFFLKIYNHRRHNFARSLIVPRFMNTEMLAVLKNYNAFREPDRWYFGHGFIVNENGDSKKTVVYVCDSSQQDMGSVNMLICEGKGKHNSTMICADEEKPWDRPNAPPSDIYLPRYKRIECFGGADSADIHSWWETIYQYASNINSNEFDENIIRATGAKFRFFG